MTRFLSAVMALGLLAYATQAPGACRLVGTQLGCDLAGTQLSFGTQTVADPPRTGPSTLQPLQDEGGPLARAAAPFRIQLQNFGANPSFCRRFGNETYCY